MISDVKFKSLQSYEIEDLIEISEWLADVDNELFIDYDGWGDYVKGDQVSNVDAHPSDAIDRINVPEWATHVLWYNR